MNNAIISGFHTNCKVLNQLEIPGRLHDSSFGNVCSPLMLIHNRNELNLLGPYMFISVLSLPVTN